MNAWMVVKLLLVGLLSVSAGAESRSIYTSVESKDCLVIDSSQWYKEPEIDFYRAECPSYGGYRVEVSGGDVRYNVKLRYGDTLFRLMALSTFHDLGSKKVEWRYVIEALQDAQKQVRFTALIYRLSFQAQDDTDREALVVVRLNQEKTCVIGVVEQTKDMNGLARSIADDPTRACVKEGDLMQTPSDRAFMNKL